MSVTRRPFNQVVLAVALRNLLGHLPRTLLTVGAIAVGVASLIFLWSFNDGLHRNMLGNFQRAIIGSLQIHHQGFFKHPELSSHIRNPQRVVDALDNSKIEHYSRRLESFGLAASDATTEGIMLIGMDPSTEGRVTELDKRIGIGRFLQPEDNYALIMGATTANNLRIKLGDSVTIVAYDRYGAMVAEAFSLIGIITSGEMGLDRGMAITDLGALQEMLDMTGKVTTFVARLPEKRIGEVAHELSTRLQSEPLEIMPWYSMFPIMKEWVTLHNGFLYLFSGVVLFIILAGELNTLLLSMLERVREFGVLMAIGTTRQEVAALLVMEALMIGVVGTLAGLALGFVIVYITSVTGIDLSLLLGATSRFYVDPLIHPQLNLEHLGITVLAILIASVTAGFYPAWRASQLQPAEAIRHG
jgi:ABC-type lipoprotein release transport system permease subunit